MDTLKITGSVGSKNRTKFNHLKLYNKNIFEFSLDKKNIGCPLMHSVNYDQPETGKDKIKYLEEMYDLNVKDFDIIKNNYFDVNPDFRAAGTLLPATTETEDFVKVHHASL